MARKIRPEGLIGRRFENGSAVWEVGRVSTVPEPVPHVEIFKVEDPTERKLISVSALLDDNAFVLIDEQD